MVWKIIPIGIGATALMTLVLYFLDFVLNEKRLKVVKVLGTMVTGQTTKDKGLSDSPLSITVGIVAHYSVGILFALIFLWLVHFTVFEFNYLHGIIYGAAAGILAAIIWNLFIAFHPDPPRLHILLFSFAIFIAHIVFGFGLILAYHAFSCMY